MKRLLGIIFSFALVCSASAETITVTPGSSGGGGGTGIVGTFNPGNLLLGGTTTAAQDTTKFGFNGGLSMSGGTVPAYNGCFWSDIDVAICPTGPENLRARERVFVGNAVNMLDTSATCCLLTFLGTNSTAAAPTYLARDAQFLSMSDRGTIGVSGMSRFSDNTSGRATIGTAGYGQNNASTGTNPTAYGGYFQCDLEAVTSGATSPQCWGVEIDAVNYGANVTGDPFGIGSGASSFWAAAGGAQSPTNPSNFAYGIGPNGTTFNEGIMIKNGALTADGNSNTVAMALSKGDGLKWYLSAGTPAGILTSNAAGQIQLGGLDQAAPVSQTIHAQSVLAGTSNTAGATMFIDGSQGSGSAGGGTLSWRTAPAGSSGTAQNALVQALGISSAGVVQVSSSNIVNTMSGATAKFAVKNNAAGFGNSAAVFSYQASNVAPATLFLGLSRNSTLNTAAVVVANDQIGQILFDSNDGTNFINSAAIVASANGTISGGNVPGSIAFQTVAVGGGTTLVTALNITNAQVLQYPTAPTGTPTASLCLDASNNIIKKTTTGSCV